MVKKELIKEIIEVNESIETGTKTTDKAINTLLHIFSDSGKCAICGLIYGHPNKIENHDKDQDHVFLETITLHIEDFTSDKIFYRDTRKMNQYNVVVEGVTQQIAIKNGSLTFLKTIYDVYTEDKTSTKDFSELNRDAQRWVINNIDKFLEEYINYCNEIKTEAKLLETEVVSKINSIITAART